MSSSDEEAGGFAPSGEGIQRLMARPVTGAETRAARRRTKESTNPSAHTDSGTYAEGVKGGYTPVSSGHATLSNALLKSQNNLLQATVFFLCLMTLFLALSSFALYDDNARMNRLFAFAEAEMAAYRESGFMESARSGSAMFSDEIQPWLRTRMSQTASLEDRAQGAADKVDVLLERVDRMASQFQGMLDGGITIGGVPKHKEASQEDEQTTWADDGILPAHMEKSDTFA